MPLSMLDFEGFFKEVHEHKPYRWQSELAKLVCNKGWPTALDMPTGTGKTAAIDIAVFHLAVEAHKVDRNACMRITYVIDRRLVVDGAFEHASKLVEQLRNAKDGTATSKVAKELQNISHNNTILDVVRLRGGMMGENDWARTPAQPTIIVSTVDQIGSRLLFRGYGVSRSMRPVHAGLLGSDTLFILDEAHLSKPFAHTLKTIEGFARKWDVTNIRPMKFISMSATLQDTDAFPHGIQRNSILQEGKIAQILNAHKYAKLKKCASESMSEEIVKEARKLAKQDHVRNIGIVVNRVSLARDVFSKLDSLLKMRADNTGLQWNVHLLTGRARPYDRDRFIKKEIDKLKNDGGYKNHIDNDNALPIDPTSNVTMTFYVATQCIEVGVDVSFDAMVTQIAPIDSLKQRFGRLNRRGKHDKSDAVIIAGNNDIGKDDPIYGKAMKNTWSYLNKQSKKDVVDFGILHLKSTRDDADMMAPTSNSVTVLPKYVHLWAQTSPIPHPDPVPSLFLHGMKTSLPDVQVIWRADITEKMLRDDTKDHKAYMKTFINTPTPLEAISVPIWVVRTWLAGDVDKDMTDIEGGVEIQDRITSGRPVVRWRGRRDQHTHTIYPRQIVPGDTIIVPTEYGGCDRYGWNDNSTEPVMDIGMEAELAYRKRLSIRFDKSLFETQLKSDAGNEAAYEDPTKMQMIESAWGRIRDITTKHMDRDHVGGLLEELTQVDTLPRIWKAALNTIQEYGIKMNLHVIEDESNERIYGIESRDKLTEMQQNHILGTSDIAEENNYESSTDDEFRTVQSSEQIELEQHCVRVEEKVRRFGSSIGMDDDLVGDMAVAARLHDAGKAETRIQALLQGLDVDEPQTGALVAKSTTDITNSTEYNRRLKIACLPKGHRHECWSVNLAQNHPLLKKAHDRDLVLYLIGTHHGYGRPLFPTTDNCTRFSENEFEFYGAKALPDDSSTGMQSDWIDMCDRLYGKYGPWNLAYMEAIVRLADHRTSEEESA